MPKGKKAKKPTLQVVSPEPAGDRWEAELQWDRIALVPPTSAGEGPQYGACPASENVFAVSYDVTEAAPQPLWAARPGFHGQRATDAFSVAERNLKATKKKAAEAGELMTTFTELATVENTDVQREKEQFSVELESVLGGLDDTELAVAEKRDEETALFFTKQESTLQRIYDLITRDHEIDDAFKERVETLAECERVVDRYYAEHSAHVNHMAAMRKETAALQEQSLEAMRAALQQTVSELMAAALLPPSSTEVATWAPTEEKALVQARESSSKVERTLLGSELAKAHGRHSDDASTTSLRRLVELEEQRVSMASARNASLRRETAALRAEAAPAPSFGASVVLSDAVATDCVDDTNALADTRRQLDTLTAELNIARDELRRVSQYHLGQLSGQCSTATLSAPDAIRTSANFLDAETSAAVRATVVEAMAELDTAMHASHTNSYDYRADEDEAFVHLFAATRLQDRKAIQNFIARRINRLFTCRYPTSPPSFVAVE